MFNRRREPDRRLSELAVLAAAAREAEELLAYEPDLTHEAIEEAERRLQLFSSSINRA